MAKKRTDRLNALLQEVLADVIRKEVGNPHLSQFTSIIRVEITADLSMAKVFVSVLGSEEEKRESLKALRSAAGFIRSCAGDEIIIRKFPELRFYLDESVEKQMRIEELLKKIAPVQEKRGSGEEDREGVQNEGG